MLLGLRRLQHESASQTSSRSVHPFLHGSRLWPTDQPRYAASVGIGRTHRDAHLCAWSLALLGGATTFSKLGGPISRSGVSLPFSGKKLRKVYAVWRRPIRPPRKSFIKSRGSIQILGGPEPLPRTSLLLPTPSGWAHGPHLCPPVLLPFLKQQPGCAATVVRDCRASFFTAAGTVFCVCASTACGLGSTRDNTLHHPTPAPPASIRLNIPPSPRRPPNCRSSAARSRRYLSFPRGPPTQKRGFVRAPGPASHLCPLTFVIVCIARRSFTLKTYNHCTEFMWTTCPTWSFLCVLSCLPFPFQIKHLTL